ncbi:MAG: dNTP triphosphohydrolase [Planctomycetia bacterium]|nr:dNTP triphosphohydrolase [Planctomycetia bacterium]
MRSSPTPFNGPLQRSSQTFVDRERALLADYAMAGAASKGRKHEEPTHAYRSPFQRDRDRIVHSTAYRRLSGKTQVFTREMGDFHRTRLTHTHEVASVSRTLGRALRLNEDLIEALALMHDIGHPPFGHAGEDVLDDCVRAQASTGEVGFSHNRQALRIVEIIEQRYPEFSGLNLSLEVLEGQQTRAMKRGSATRPLLESQVVDAADSTAYDTHDVDDALHLGLLTIAELDEVPLWREATSRVRSRYAALEAGELKRCILHELIDWQVSDLLACSTERLEAWGIESTEQVRQAQVIVRPNDELFALKAELEKFLYARVYRHPTVVASRLIAQQQLREMFAGFTKRPELMPESFRQRIEVYGLGRSVCDYLAGMTDRFCQQEYLRLFPE